VHPVGPALLDAGRLQLQRLLNEKLCHHADEWVIVFASQESQKWPHQRRLLRD